MAVICCCVHLHPVYSSTVGSLCHQSVRHLVWGRIYPLTYSLMANWQTLPQNLQENKWKLYTPCQRCQRYYYQKTDQCHMQIKISELQWQGKLIHCFLYQLITSTREIQAYKQCTLWAWITDSKNTIFPTRPWSLHPPNLCGHKLCHFGAEVNSHVILAKWSSLVIVQGMPVQLWCPLCKL